MTKRSRQTRQAYKIAVICLLGVAVGGALYLSVPYQQKAAPGTPAPTAQPAGPAYAGEADLIKRGLLSDQVAAIKDALANYASSQNKTVKAVTFSNVQHSIDKTPEGDTIHGYSFHVALDNAPYVAKVSLVSDSSIRLYIFDIKDPAKLLYDSGENNAKAQPQR